MMEDLKNASFVLLLLYFTVNVTVGFVGVAHGLVGDRKYNSCLNAKKTARIRKLLAPAHKLGCNLGAWLGEIE